MSMSLNSMFPSGLYFDRSVSATRVSENCTVQSASGHIQISVYLIMMLLYQFNASIIHIKEV